MYTILRVELFLARSSSLINRIFVVVLSDQIVICPHLLPKYCCAIVNHETRERYPFKIHSLFSSIRVVWLFPCISHCPIYAFTWDVHVFWLGSDNMILVSIRTPIKRIIRFIRRTFFLWLP